LTESGRALIKFVLMTKKIILVGVLNAKLCNC
jgi:hypothetical protein